ncbi:MAG: hypothetical protein GY835_01660 [bacterium]|nr:hypothetical protein [bacterium]
MSADSGRRAWFRRREEVRSGSRYDLAGDRLDREIVRTYLQVIPHRCGPADIIGDMVEPGLILKLELSMKSIRKLAPFVMLLWLSLPLACGEEPDTEGPIVKITAPSIGQMVSADFLIQATAADNEGIARVKIAVDDEILVELDAPPWEYLWVIADYADGQTHNIQAAATDTAGNMTLSDYVTVTVSER